MLPVSTARLLIKAAYKMKVGGDHRMEWNGTLGKHRAVLTAVSNLQ